MENDAFTTATEISNFNKMIVMAIETHNPEFVKDYLIMAFDKFNPEKGVDEHPCRDRIEEAEVFMKKQGWKVGFCDWGEEKGVQYTCVTPDGGHWYRSHYQH